MGKNRAENLLTDLKKKHSHLEVYLLLKATKESCSLRKEFLDPLIKKMEERIDIQLHIKDKQEKEKQKQIRDTYTSVV